MSNHSFYRRNTEEYQQELWPNSLNPVSNKTPEKLEKTKITPYQRNDLETGREGFAVYKIHPQEFLNLTANESFKPTIHSQARPHDFYENLKAKDEVGAPYLATDPDGNIIGHEGRHRAAAALKAGHDSMDIGLVAASSEYPVEKYGWKWKRRIPIPQKLTAQKFGLPDDPTHEHVIDHAKIEHIEPMYGDQFNKAESLIGGKGDKSQKLQKSPMILDTGGSDWAIQRLQDADLAVDYGQVLSTNQVGDNLFHHHIREDNNRHYHILTENKDPTLGGAIAMASGYPQKNKHLQIDSAAVEPILQGKGYGKKLYGIAAKIHGGIMSDHNISEDAHRLYQSFSKNPDFKTKLGPTQYELAGSKDPNKYKKEALKHPHMVEPNNKSESLIGGKGDKSQTSDFDPKQVAMGRKVEMEHTKNPKVAEDILKDHLKENPRYYSKLKQIGLADELGKADKLNRYGFSTNQSRLNRYKHEKGVNMPYAMGTGEVGISGQGYSVRGELATYGNEQKFRQPQGGPYYNREKAKQKAATTLKELKAMPKPDLGKSLSKAKPVDFNQYGFSHGHDGSEDGIHHIHVYKKSSSGGGDFVGEFQFATDHPSAPNKLYPLLAEVDPEHRQKGIASEAYKMAEQISGKKIVPSHSQTQSAKQMWNQPNRPFGESLEKNKRVPFHTVQSHIDDLHFEGVNRDNPETDTDDDGNPDLFGVHKHPEYELKSVAVKDIEHGDPSFPSAVSRYAQQAQEGSSFPPVLLNRYSEALDGWHRIAAAKQLGHTHIPAYVPVVGNSKTVKKSQLQKMSQPRITFPAFKSPTRPDQEVQPVENERQKKIFGGKIAAYRRPDTTANNSYEQQPDGTMKFIQSKPQKISFQPQRSEDATYYSNKIGRKNLGINVPVVPINQGDQPRGKKSFQAAVAGKLRSKYEPHDDDTKKKHADWLAEHNRIVTDYNDRYTEWRNKGMALKNPNPQEWAEFMVSKPEKPKIPRKPSVKALDTKKLGREAQIARGKSYDSAIEHEGFHGVIDDLENKAGTSTGREAIRVLSQPFKDAGVHDLLSSFVSDRMGYKRSSPSFHEEVLANTRDILTDPRKKQLFRDFIQNHHKGYRNLTPIQRDRVFWEAEPKIKAAWKKAHQISQQFKPTKG